MNINLIRFKGLLRELKNIRIELTRIADCYEADLKEKQIYIRPPEPNLDREMSLMYIDEEMDAVQEMIDQERTRRHQVKESEEDV